MRNGASLLASLEGISRTTYRIARELSNNSRSGLTVRFLSKKLGVPEEEVEYLLDINHRLMFTDLTKIKVVPEGHQAVRRIAEGLENHGDVPSMIARVKSLDPHDFRRLEERLGADQTLTKKAAAELLLEKYYKHADSPVHYVATRGFSGTALEVFDILWQSHDGVMSVSQIRALHGGSEYEVEQALWELFQGFACFEMFRFDGEDRLVRVAGLLSEIRQYRKNTGDGRDGVPRLKAVKGHVESRMARDLGLSETTCRLTACVAGKPVRMRGDGELFREDRRRLEEICGDEDDPSLSTCLWIGAGVGWLATVDNALLAQNLEPVISMSRIERHRVVFDWMMRRPEEAPALNSLEAILEEIKPDSWYRTLDAVSFAMTHSEDQARPVLRAAGGHYEYINPAAAARNENRLARALEESLYWLGVVERGVSDGENCFRITPLGEMLLRGKKEDAVGQRYQEFSAELVVQPNFDIVVPIQDMDPLLTVPLDQFGVRVSTGQVAVYSLSKESFVQAVQNGHSGAGFIDFLVRHNRGHSLPSNVMATLEDWGGAIKRVRVRTYHVIESDDPLVMADLVHRRKFAKFFEGIDPHKTVRYEGVSRGDLEKALEKEGFIVD
jgi:hypothetical protein